MIRKKKKKSEEDKEIKEGGRMGEKEMRNS
jgi:hypothetical protein